MRQFEGGVATIPNVAPNVGRRFADTEGGLHPIDRQDHRLGCSLAVVLAALALFSSGCDVGGGGSGKSAVDEAQFVIDEFVSYQEQAAQDEEGVRAGLTALGPRKTRVVIEMDGDVEPLLRAEIRNGNCDVVTSARVYLLNDVKEGKSDTVIDESLDELRAGSGYLILIRRLNEPSEFAGLCGDIALAEETGVAR